MMIESDDDDLARRVIQSDSEDGFLYGPMLEDVPSKSGIWPFAIVT